MCYRPLTRSVPRSISEKKHPALRNSATPADSMSLRHPAAGNRSDPSRPMVVGTKVFVNLPLYACAPVSEPTFGHFQDLRPQQTGVTVDCREYPSDWCDGLRESTLIDHPLLPCRDMWNLYMVHRHSPSCSCIIVYLSRECQGNIVA